MLRLTQLAACAFLLLPDRQPRESQPPARLAAAAFACRAAEAPPCFRLFAVGRPLATRALAQRRLAAAANFARVAADTCRRRRGCRTEANRSAPKREASRRSRFSICRRNSKPSFIFSSERSIGEIHDFSYIKIAYSCLQRLLSHLNTSPALRLCVPFRKCQLPWRQPGPFSNSCLPHLIGVLGATFSFATSTIPNRALPCTMRARPAAACSLVQAPEISSLLQAS